MRMIERLSLLLLAFGCINCDGAQRHAGASSPSSTPAVETPGDEGAQEVARPAAERDREAPPVPSTAEDGVQPTFAGGSEHAGRPRTSSRPRGNPAVEGAGEPSAQGDPIARLIEAAKATPERCGASLARAQVRIAKAGPDCDSDDDCALVHQACEPLLCTMAGHVDVAEDMKRLHAAAGPPDCLCDLSGQRCAASVAKCLKGRCALAKP